jgi:hypothetical protein
MRHSVIRGKTQGREMRVWWIVIAMAAAAFLGFAWHTK